MELLIVTGMSGAGKTQALRFLEDIGYYCVDNLPPQLLSVLMEQESRAESPRDKMAVTVDIRSDGLPSDISRIREALRAMDIQTKILFLDAEDEQLRRRFKETKRLHPLTMRRRAKDLTEALKLEREQLAPLRELADDIIDTTGMQRSELRSILVHRYTSKRYIPMSIEFIAFGYKYGIPAEADLVFDVRCLPNPFYEESMRDLNGNDEAVRNYIFSKASGRAFFEKMRDFLECAIPMYMQEGKPRLLVGFGCTGGQHRSLAAAGLLQEYFAKKYPEITVTARDLAENSAEIKTRNA